MNHKAGFTLIEILISAAIFSLIVVAATGIFITSISSQQKSLAFQKVLNESSYVMEYMARALRMAQKESSAPDCLSQNGLNYEKTRGGKGIKFINSKEECQEFYWDTNTNQLKEAKDGVENYLTSENLKVSPFNIKLSGESRTDDSQPRVTIFLDIKAKGQKPQSQFELKLQTTISQRNLDI